MNFFLFLARQCHPDVYSLKMYSYFHLHSRFVGIDYRGRILGRNWDKSLIEFSSLLFTVTSTNGFNPPPPSEQNLFETGLSETSCLITLKIMHRNLNEKLYVHEFGFGLFNAITQYIFAGLEFLNRGLGTEKE
jgi:hypothetical protein